MPRIISSILCLLLCTAPLGAQTPEDLVQIEVLPGWQTDAGTWMAGIRFRLAPGWKTYWRAPGEAGIPPLFTWEGSQNVAAAAFHWPVPQVFDQSGMQSIGYAGDVVIPVEITPGSDGSAPRLAGSVEIGVCHEICVPVALDFAADLLPGTQRDPAIVAALVDRPLTAAEGAVRAVSCRVEAVDGGLSVTATLEMPPVGPQEVVVIETADPTLWVSEAETQRSGNLLTATAQVISGNGGAVAIDRSGLRLTVLADGSAVDIRGCPAG